jgi:DNA adenine methylase
MLGLAEIPKEDISMQLSLNDDDVCIRYDPPKGQLLKWIGNKHRFARKIISYFPSKFGTYFEPFIGSGAVLAALAPQKALASDVFGPLMEIWQALRCEPEKLKEWYAVRWGAMKLSSKMEAYERIRASYNEQPNGPDLLFLCRSCYGGVVRFRAADGFMSTPCGIHEPISPRSFNARVDEWHRRISGTVFLQLNFEEAMARAKHGDLIYCDPPYSHTQSILYKAQEFKLTALLDSIGRCKARGVHVALSIDGTKKSGDYICDVPIEKDLFNREILIDGGRSMLRRFQMGGKSLEKEVVADRLALTW